MLKEIELKLAKAQEVIIASKSELETYKVREQELLAKLNGMTEEKLNADLLLADREEAAIEAELDKIAQDLKI